MNRQGIYGYFSARADGVFQRYVDFIDKKSSVESKLLTIVPISNIFVVPAISHPDSGSVPPKPVAHPVY